MLRQFLNPIKTKTQSLKTAVPVSLNKLKTLSISKPVSTFNKISHNFSFNRNSLGYYDRFSNYIHSLPRPLYQYIMGINGGIFLLMNIPIFDRMFLTKNLACSPVAMSEGRIWTMITSGFTHVSFLHLLFNGFSLFFFGR